MKDQEYNFLFTKIEGWARDDELIWLYERAKRSQSVIEIGVWKGRSTFALANGCSKIYAVDNFKGNSDERGKDQPHFEATQKDISIEFLNNLIVFSDKLTLYKMDSIEAAKLFKPKSIDMVYLDAGHLYPEIKTDLDVWLPITRKLICGHDYFREDVMQAVQERFSKTHLIRNSGRIWFVELENE
jgi:hypothetical protein